MEQLKGHIVFIGVVQYLSNSDLYEIICLEEIKNYYKYSGKCYYKQQYKGILEAGMISITEGLRESITISLSMSVPV